MNIVQACFSNAVFRPLFKDLRTWQNWMTFLKVLFGLPLLNYSERKLFQTCTGLRTPPRERLSSAFVCAGRRSGKSRISSVIACFLALFHDWRPYLSPGERGHIFIIATDKFQAGIVFNYISGILHSTQAFERMIERETQETIDLNNRVSIMVKTASYRSLRGFTLLACILEEVAFFRDENSANPDREILNAVKPALSTIPDSLLLGISTPYSRSGVLWEMYRGREKRGAPLVWRASTEIMNPTINKKLIKNALREDYASGSAEWLAEFRQDISSFLSLELIESSLCPGRIELPKVEGITYHAFCDPSGGRGDSMTLAISHRDSATGKVILDLLREKRPPFRPQSVVEEFSEVLKEYEVTQIQADRYSAEWCSSAFRDNGVMVENSEQTASDLYLTLLPLLSNNSIELLDDKRLVSQLRSLERRTRSGGRDQIIHPPGLHDDVSNACAGACVMASKSETFRIMPSRGLMEPHEREGVISERDRNILYTEAEIKQKREEAKEENKLLHRIVYVDDDGNPISGKEFMRQVREEGREKA